LTVPSLAALTIGLAFAPLPLRGSSPPADSVPGARCSILLYAGGAGRRHYSIADLVALVAVVDTAGRPVAWLCQGAVLLELQATSGRNYYPWPGGPLARGQDWNAYLDSVFAPRGPLAGLDSAHAVIAMQLGPEPGGGELQVVVMIPYPARTPDTTWVGHEAFSLADSNGPRHAIAAYVDEVERRFVTARWSHLRLTGYYWLNEGVLPDDTLLVQQAAAIVHGRGRRLLWIPSFEAPGISQWRGLGFDQVWLQPNYFFHPELPVTRLDSAIGRARADGMGLELEFDDRMFTDRRFADRLAPYLAALENAADIRGRPIAIYDASGSLIRLARSRESQHRALYARLVAVLRSH
jgi:hypothetical protein